jgi:hypothetical protein
VDYAICLRNTPGQLTDGDVIGFNWSQHFSGIYTSRNDLRWINTGDGYKSVHINCTINVERIVSGAPCLGLYVNDSMQNSYDAPDDAEKSRIARLHTPGSYSMDVILFLFPYSVIDLRIVGGTVDLAPGTSALLSAVLIK